MVALENHRGTKDFWPDEQITREWILTPMSQQFALYVIKPAETPITNNFEVLSLKYAGGAEILKETYKVSRPKKEAQEEGKERLGLRYDLTVPLAKLVGTNPRVRLPFKRFEIGKVFRDGPTRVGRLKEFTQCDADVIGSKSMVAEAELIALALKAFVQVNNRKLLAGIIEESGIPAKKAGKAILAIDKLEKITTTGVQKELAELGVKEKAMEKLFSLIETTGGFEEVLSSLEGRLKGETALEGLGEAKELLSALKEFVGEKRVTPSVNLARGLEYYTGTVFEAFLEESGIKSAIAGGGRYDKMIGSLIESKEELPAVGISFGLDVLFEALKEKGKARTNTNTKVFVLPIRTLNASTKLCQELRNAGVPSEVDLMDRSISKNLEYASAEGIPFVLILGQRELEKGTATLRDMASGKQEELKLSEVVNSVKQRL